MIDHLLSVEMMHGYGWSLWNVGGGHSASRLVGDLVGTETKFSMKYIEPTFAGGQLDGGIGCVVNKGHPFDGLYAAFFVFFDETIDFTMNKAGFKIFICHERPDIKPVFKEPHQMWIINKEVVYAGGWARVGIHNRERE